MAWINILHKEPSSKVRVNGHPSSFFRVEWRVRQVDSLSPILFVLNIETLAETFCQNVQIQGIVNEAGLIHQIALNK